MHIQRPTVGFMLRGCSASGGNEIMPVEQSRRFGSGASVRTGPAAPPSYEVSAAHAAHAGQAEAWLADEAQKSARALVVLRPGSTMMRHRSTTLRSGVVWLALALSVGMLPVAGKAQTVEWARSAGGATLDAGSEIAVDANGNSYVTGNFTGTATFGSVTITSAGGADAFVAKYDKLGALVWAKSRRGVSTVGGVGIAVDASGNSYVTGSFLGTAQVGSFSITSAGDFDLYLAKYDTNGTVLWAKAFGGISPEFSTDIALDANGDIHITGEYFNTATFGPFDLVSQGFEDMFVAKFDGAGSILWVRSAGGSGVRDEGRAIAVDTVGNSYVTGRFRDTATFGSLAITSTGAEDVYLAKYDPSGNVLWVRSGGGTLADHSFGVAVDAFGNSYITGGYLEAASFAPFMLTSVGSLDIFVVKYDSRGSVVWARSAGGTGSNESGDDIGVDAFGNSYITGTYNQTALFGPLTLRSVGGSSDVFVASYDAAGEVLWVRSVGGPNGERSLGLAVTTVGSVYVTGQFGFRTGGTATFGAFDITSAGEQDIYVAKFTAPANTAVPAASQWGLIVMALLLLLAGAKVYSNKRRPARA